MNYGESGCLSASDVALLTGNNRGNDGFGGENSSWWIIIFLIFAFMGWGRNGFGGNNGGGSDGIGTNYVLASDFATLQRQIDSSTATLERKADSTQQGLCDGFYAMAQQFPNTNQNIFAGNADLQQTLCQGFAGVNTAIVQNGYETRLGTQNLAAQLSNCCCDVRQQIADCCCTTQRGIDGINYNMAMNTNNIQQTLCNNTRDLIENQNRNYRALHDEIVANRMEDKNIQIQAQQNEINALRLAASQERQNNYLIKELKPCPQPSYVVQPPSNVTFPTNCCGTFSGFNSNCGCGCGNF